MGEQKLQRRARVLALQALYAQEQQKAALKSDIGALCANEILKFTWLDREPSESELLMAKYLVQGVRHNIETIDDLIVGHLQHWTLDRLLAVDCAVLRLGIYMLKYLLDTPQKVIIDECIELCHKFSSEDSYRLVNGVLDTLGAKLRPGSSGFSAEPEKPPAKEPEELIEQGKL